MCENESEKIQDVWSTIGSNETYDRLMSVISTYSRCPDDHFFLDEWIINSTTSTGNSNNNSNNNSNDNSSTIKQGICICSRESLELYFLQNKYNGNVLQICKDCIIKHGTKVMKLSILSSSDSRICEKCQTNTLDKSLPSWMKECEECYKFKDNNNSNTYNIYNTNGTYSPKEECRPCVLCGANEIPISKPEWADKCHECYINHRSKEYRECTTCGKFDIPLGKPEWVDKCNKCFINQKSMDYRECSVCGMHNILRTLPMTVSICDNCIKLNNSSNINTNNNSDNKNNMSSANLKVTYRECATCHQLNVEANKPLYIKECLQCYSKSKKEDKACVDCGSKCIPRTSSEKYCSECSEVRQELMRECEVCGQKKIGPEEPHYKTKCIECFKATIDTSQFRQCRLCGLMRIKITDPEWKNLCTKCYAKTARR